MRQLRIGMENNLYFGWDVVVGAGQGDRKALLEIKGMGSSCNYSYTNITLYYKILKHPRSKDFSLFSLQEKMWL